MKVDDYKMTEKELPDCWKTKYCHECGKSFPSVDYEEICLSCKEDQKVIYDCMLDEIRDVAKRCKVHQ